MEVCNYFLILSSNLILKQFPILEKKIQKNILKRCRGKEPARLLFFSVINFTGTITLSPSAHLLISHGIPIVGGLKGQIHPAFNFKVGIITKTCEEGLADNQWIQNPSPRAAAESPLAAPTAPFTFKADKHTPGRPEDQVCVKQAYNP